MNRFRPNFVIDGRVEAFEEDTWGKIDIVLQSAELSDDEEHDDEDELHPAVLHLSFGRHCTRYADSEVLVEPSVRITHS
jgi:hypothetical protein